MSQRNFKRTISEHVEIALTKPTPDMWDRILTVFRKTLSKSEASYLTKAKSELSQSPRMPTVLIP